MNEPDELDGTEPEVLTIDLEWFDGSFGRYWCESGDEWELLDMLDPSTLQIVRGWRNGQTWFDAAEGTTH